MKTANFVIFYKDIQTRSKWEARLAHAFDNMGWGWEYEPRQFQYDLADGAHIYTPDFYVSHLDCYFDPHWSLDYAGDKFRAVREQCGITLIVLDKSLLEMYERVARV